MSVLDAQEYHTNQVHFLRATVAYGDDGTAVSLGWVPAGAALVRGGAVVSTAFDAGTTNTLNVGFRNAGDGTSDDDNEYASLIALGTAGVIVADDMATAADSYHPEGAELTATVVLTGTAATAGSAVVWMEYTVDNS